MNNALGSNSTNNRYFASQSEVRAAFIEAIRAVSGHGLDVNDIASYADSMVGSFWYHYSGKVPRTSAIFDLAGKCETIAKALPDMGVTNKILLHIFKSSGREVPSTEKVIENSRLLVDLMMSLRDPILHVSQRHKVKAKPEAFQYLVYGGASSLFSASPGVLDLYRQYIRLVAAGEIKFDGDFIFALSVFKLKNELSPHGVCRATLVRKPASASKPQRPKIVLDNNTPEGRNALAQKMLAQRAKGATAG